MITSLDPLAAVLLIQQYLDQKMGKIHLLALHHWLKGGTNMGTSALLKCLPP